MSHISLVFESLTPHISQVLFPSAQCMQGEECVSATATPFRLSLNWCNWILHLNLQDTVPLKTNPFWWA